jgi:hypothetical protein
LGNYLAFGRVGFGDGGPEGGMEEGRIEGEKFGVFVFVIFLNDFLIFGYQN